MEARQDIDPISLALALTYKHRKLFLTLSLLPFFVESAGAYFQYFTPLEQKHVFLIAVITIAANAWLLIAVFVAIVDLLQNRPVHFKAVAAQGVRFLPKVFLSYLTLVSLVLSVASVPQLLPLLVPVLFFIWAPCFCAGELYVPPKRYSEDDDAHASVYDEDDDYIVRKSDRPPARSRLRLFAQKSLWELGFSRSLHFSGQHLAVTFQILVIYWFANVLPPALLDLFSAAHPGFIVLFLKIGASSITNVVALTIVLVVFVLLLPAEAKQEIGAKDLELAGLTPQRIRVQRRKPVFAVLLICAVLATMLSFNQVRRERSVPREVQIDLAHSERLEKALELHFRIFDPVNQYRWLEIESLRVVFDLAPSAGRKLEPRPEEKQEEKFGSAGEFPPHEFEKQAAESPLEYVQPQRISVLTEEGQELPLGRISPYYGPLKIVMTVAVPEGLPVQGTLTLYHFSLLGTEGAELFRGSYGFGWQ